MFIGCAPKSDGVNAIHFIPGLTEDMLALEKGIPMYCSNANETVLMVAPVMFICADNPAHSDICGLLQQTTLYFCKKCYRLKLNKKKGKTLEESGVSEDRSLEQHLQRKRERYVLAASDNSRDNTYINDSLLTGSTLSAHKLNYKHRETFLYFIILLESLGNCARDWEKVLTGN
jgi:hypothetical protein